MFGLGKLHNDDFNPPLCRPVASVVCSPLHRIGRWIDMHLIEFLPFCRKCIKNSGNVIKKVKGLKSVSNNYFISTCDVEAMHHNFKTEEVFKFIYSRVRCFSL